MLSLGYSCLATTLEHFSSHLGHPQLTSKRFHQYELAPIAFASFVPCFLTLQHLGDQLLFVCVFHANFQKQTQLKRPATA